MLFRNLTKLLIILFFFLNFVSLINAKEANGIIVGVARDEDGNPLPGVNITIRSPAIAPRSVVTDETGVYRFPDLLPGEYYIIAELPGFKTLIRKNIPIQAEEIKIVDFLMQMAAIEEEIIPADAYVSVYTLNEMLDEEIEELSIGQILFNPPEIMKVGIKERIEVRISQNIQEDLTESLRGRGLPRVEEIIVGSVMKVRLSGEAFKIESFSDEVQFIGSSGYTQWEWDVIPIKSGNKLIHLSLSVSVYLRNYGEKIKSLPVMDKEILVKVNIPYSFCNFIKNNWQWIVGTIIAVLGLLFGFIKCKKRRENHGS